jgi:type I restriction enzyme S subunit
MKPNWKKVSLGELQTEGLADIQTGPFGTVLKASEYTNHGVPVISVGEIRTGFIQISGRTPFVSKKITKRLPQFVLNHGDIVFGRKGAIDRNSIINENQSGWFLGSDGIRLRLSQEINSIFVSYQLRSNSVGKWLLQNSSGSIMPSLNQKILDRLPIWLPEISTQNRIASILSNIDAKIELNNKINQQLEAMAKLIYDYWFVQFDFPDENGKPYKSSGGKMVYNSELKREIPAGWGADEIGNLLIQEPRTSKIKSANYLDRGSTPIIDQSKNFICGYTNDQDAVISTEVPRIIFGDHTRILKLVNFDFARGADGTQVLLSGNDSVPQHLFFQYLSKIDLSNYGYARHFKFLKSRMIAVPGHGIAHKYEIIAKSIYSRIRLGIFENRELTILRDWLLPMLMNGQVTVREETSKTS